jgi:hypothetical protein
MIWEKQHRGKSRNEFTVERKLRNLETLEKFDRWSSFEMS